MDESRKETIARNANEIYEWSYSADDYYVDGRTNEVFCGSLYVGKIRGNRLYLDRKGFNTWVALPAATSNPVIQETPLVGALQGWVVREYRNGKWDAIFPGTFAISPGYDSFLEVCEFIAAEMLSLSGSEWFHKGMPS